MKSCLNEVDDHAMRLKKDRGSRILRNPLLAIHFLLYASCYLPFAPCNLLLRLQFWRN